MKLALDDIRKFPDGFDFCVRTYDDCIFYLNTVQHFEFVSLDYALGEYNTGFDVLVYMHDHNIYPEHINIHSTHSIGAPMMLNYIKENFPKDIKVTINRLSQPK